jgi:hypothetical protein
MIFVECVTEAINSMGRILFVKLVDAQLVKKYKRSVFLGDKGRPARGADNLTAICEPIV